MIFGALPLTEAEGTYLAHSLTLEDRTLKKGQKLAAADISELRENGYENVVAAKLEENDVHEDEAARRLGAALCGPGLAASHARTGRCNLTAKQRGLVAIDAERLKRINAVDESITVATLGAFEPAETRQMAATVKIIPLAVAKDALQRCLAIAEEEGPAIRVAPFAEKRIGLLQTTLPGTKASVLDKGRASIDVRLAALGCLPSEERRCEHDAGAISAAVSAFAEAGCEILLVAGASAIIDRRDVVPEGIRRAGGTIERFGLPVDPGNLSLLARKDGLRILGVPGSFRSPKLSGHDWILQRWVAGLDVTGDEIASMGLGGLLKEVGGRPLPRAAAVERTRPASAEPRVAALVLAAGKSSRMGSNKLLEEISGKPMAAWAVEAAREAGCAEILVVTGRDSDALEAALSAEDVCFVHNAAFEDGLASSLKAGIAALSESAEAAVVLLGDMPRLRAAHLRALIAAYKPSEGAAICVPSYGGKRGNPVLFGRRYFPEIQTLSGDSGARTLIAEHAEAVAEVPVEDDAILLDIDTPEALAAFKEG